MNWAGTETIQAEELTVIPGLDEIFALIDVKTHVESGAYDMLVVDCAPTAETLRLLSLPEIMNWYIERIFPVERKVVKAVRPIVSKMTTLPIAGDKVFAAVERLHRNLDDVKTILTDEKVSSVRLVVNPEKMVIAEARRTYTYLGLFGYRVDAVVVNRIIPRGGERPLLRQVEGHPGRAPRHRRASRSSRCRSCEARLFDREMVGVPLLEEMAAEVYGNLDATAILFHDDPIRVRKHADGYVLSMRLPFVSRDDMDVHRRGDELFVRVGSYKRNLILPQTLEAYGGARKRTSRATTWRSPSAVRRRPTTWRERRWGPDAGRPRDRHRRRRDEDRLLPCRARRHDPRPRCAADARARPGSHAARRWSSLGTGGGHARGGRDRHRGCRLGGSRTPASCGSHRTSPGATRRWWHT